MVAESTPELRVVGEIQRQGVVGVTFKPKISAKNPADAFLSLAGTMVWSS